MQQKNNVGDFVLAVAGNKCDMDEEEYVSMLNRVLRIVGLHAQLSRFDECAQASVFVAIFERLFQVRLSNVIRNPETYEDRVLNCQRVIDALGGVIIVLGLVCVTKGQGNEDAMVFPSWCRLADDDGDDEAEEERR